MGKKGRNQKKFNKNPKGRPDEDVNPEDMDDEIDAFHKQRDVIPLDVNGDVEDSDDDNEHPVFDIEENNDEEDEKDDEDDNDDDSDDYRDTGMAAKIKRQQKILRAKFGGVEDEMHDDEDDNEDKEKKALWGGKKNQYYYGDNRDFELQSSDDESPAEEEEEVKRMLKERAKSLAMEDFGLQDTSGSEDESDRELTLEEKSAKGEGTRRSPTDDVAVDVMDTAYEEVKKDLSSLSKEEQMDIVYSSAPELVGLLSELNDALEELEKKVNPLLNKIKEREIKFEDGLHYLEVKQILLVAYCQAITFYLLLKSDGQPVRDHPVIARLVEIKGLLDKMNQLDGNLPSEFDNLLKEDHTAVKTPKSAKTDALVPSDSVSYRPLKPSDVPSDREQASVQKGGTDELEKEDPLEDQKSGKRKRQNDQVGVHSTEMLKVRAALEEKLKQKGVFSSITPKPNKANKRGKLVNGQLETYDDFDDDTMDVEHGTVGLSNGHGSSLQSSKLSQLVTTQANKPKAISGDDDLPQRDDIGERRRKHELRVLAGAGITSEDGGIDEVATLGDDEDGDNVDDEDDIDGESEDEFYKQVKQQRAAKLAAKADIYKRTPVASSLAEEIVDGKRHISYQMEKNRGLTRTRKKEAKNPRKKYRTKHEKAVVRRKGQVRDIRKPAGPYGGETTGINPGISRSTRFKS